MQIKTAYETAILKKFPDPVAVLIVKDAQGKCNPMALSWSTLTSHEPPMMAVSIAKTRYSLAAVRESKSFVVSFPTSNMDKDVTYFGSSCGRDVDKFAERSVKTQPASEIDCVLIADAVANFECVVESELETGDHVLVVGRVVASHVGEDAAARRLFTLQSGQLGGVISP